VDWVPGSGKYKKWSKLEMANVGLEFQRILQGRYPIPIVKLHLLRREVKAEDCHWEIPKT
jgi:hypothetical protein